MQNKEDERHISQDGDNTAGSLGNARVPSSLLPTVLHRLGLLPEQALPETSLDDVIAPLKSDDWEVRIAAVRALEKLETADSVELLVSALDDEDGSVRAAAVHALGNAGKQAPLHRLVAALGDADWHVRETAVLALGKQGQRVPPEVLMTALHDTDGSVREAAELALQWTSAEEKTPVSYGRLWEKKIMQDTQHDSTLSNGQETGVPIETVPYDTWDGSSEGSGNGQREQVQAYAPQEYAFHEYGDTLYSQGEKITPSRRWPQKAWWAVVAFTGVLFFLLGAGTTMWMMPTSTAFIRVQPEPPIAVRVFPFENLKYSWTVQNAVATALHLAPQQITSDLQEGKSMDDIATAQGISSLELRNIELKAFAQFFDEAVKAGDIDQQQAREWMQRLQNQPPLLDKMTIAAFLAGPGPH